MGEPRWYRSLYWRIAVGFVAVLAVLLAAQVLVFIWITGRAPDAWPGRTPAEYAQAIAAEAATALTDQPGADLRAHLQQRFANAYRAWVVVLRDRQTIPSAVVPPLPPMVRATLVRLGLETPPASDGARGGRGRGGRGGGAPLVFVPVRVGEAVVGMVSVSQAAPPLSAALSQWGPTLALQAFGMLCVGALLAAVVVFGPARRRLRRLQDAVRAFGSGQTSVRASTERGG